MTDRATERPWKWNKGADATWSLWSPAGLLAATVYQNGTWHTWDEDGVGGQNDSENLIGEAKRQAWASLFEHEWHGLVAPEGHPSTGPRAGR